MAKKKSEEDISLRDELSSLIAKSINAGRKDDKAAFFVGEEETPTDLSACVSTGSSILDLIISNRPSGGLFAGRVIEITGDEGAGKSLVCQHLIAETQKIGGLGVYIDTENAYNVDFSNAIGVDNKKMVYIYMNLVEDIFDTIEKIVEKVRVADETKEKRFVTIIVDSIAGATDAKEDEADFAKAGYNTGKAIIIGKAMRKLTGLIAKEKILLVFTNQLRTNMNAMAFSDPYSVPGGKAIPFHASCRIRLRKAGQLKTKVNGIDLAIGIKTSAEIKKNRFGPPLRKCEFNIYFDSGIDNYGSWLIQLKNYDIVKSAGAWYTIKNQHGEPIKFQSKEWKSIIEADPEFKEFIYKKLCSKLVMNYKTKDIGIDDISIDTDGIDEDLLTDTFIGETPDETEVEDIFESEE
jgi:recombination protein RecA